MTSLEALNKYRTLAERNSNNLSQLKDVGKEYLDIIQKDLETLNSIKVNFKGFEENGYDKKMVFKVSDNNIINYRKVRTYLKKEGVL